MIRCRDWWYLWAVFGGPLIARCYILDRLDVQTLWQPMFQTHISLSLLLSCLCCLPPLRFIPHPLFRLPLSFSQFLMFWENAPSVSMETAIDCQRWTTLWPGSKQGHKKENISADQWKINWASDLVMILMHRSKGKDVFGAFSHYSFHLLTNM